MSFSMRFARKARRYPRFSDTPRSCAKARSRRAQKWLENALSSKKSENKRFFSRSALNKFKKLTPKADSLKRQCQLYHIPHNNEMRVLYFSGNLRLALVCPETRREKLKDMPCPHD
jgi:hypothetical protein